MMLNTSIWLKYSIQYRDCIYLFVLAMMLLGLPAYSDNNKKIKIILLIDDEVHD